MEDIAERLPTIPIESLGNSMVVSDDIPHLVEVFGR